MDNFKTGAEFDGETYVPTLDKPRLTSQLQRVHDLMSDGRWRNLRMISNAVGCSEASASARLRDLRKEKFGGLTVDRKRNEGGLFLYRLGAEQKELF